MPTRRQAETQNADMQHPDPSKVHTRAFRKFSNYVSKGLWGSAAISKVLQEAPQSVKRLLRKRSCRRDSPAQKLHDAGVCRLG
eukprot:11017774-Alexandrium_andersonii.AAC.1